MLKLFIWINMSELQVLNSKRRNFLPMRGLRIKGV